jgi:hypothetical protein
MKNLFTWKAGVAALGLILLCAAPVSAQSTGIRADVPFAFSAANQNLPAGAYRFSLDVDQKVVRITEENGNRVWLVRLVSGGEDRGRATIDTGLLRFKRNGNSHDLRGVFPAGSMFGKSVMPSAVPKEIGPAK